MTDSFTLHNAGADDEGPQLQRLDPHRQVAEEEEEEGWYSHLAPLSLQTLIFSP